MNYFRFYVLDKSNRLLRTTDLIADNKIVAIGIARELLAVDPQWFAFELWQHARRVHKEIRSMPEEAPTPLACTFARLIPRPAEAKKPARQPRVS